MSGRMGIQMGTARAFKPRQWKAPRGNSHRWDSAGDLPDVWPADGSWLRLATNWDQRGFAFVEHTPAAGDSKSRYLQALAREARENMRYDGERCLSDAQSTGDGVVIFPKVGFLAHCQITVRTVADGDADAA